MKRQTKRKLITAGVLAAVAAVAGTAIGLTWLLPDKPLDLSVVEGSRFSAPRPKPVDGLDLPESGYAVAAENSRLRLEVDAGETLVRIVDKETGTVWGGGYPVEEYAGDLIPRNRRVMTALLSLTYTDYENSQASVTNTANGVTTVLSGLQDGVEFAFTFPEQEITVCLQLYLDDTGFYARIPREKIREDGAAAVVSVDLLPAFGSLFSGTDGYLVYPDGSGALYDCRDTGVQATMYSCDIYGDHAGNMDAVDRRTENGYKSIPIPYFGSASGGRAAVGYVVEGAEYARITFSPGTSVFALNRLYASVEYRQTLTVQSSQDKEIAETSKEAADTDLCVKYCLLTGEDATYSGMASALRAYMQQTGRLPQTPAGGTDGVPLAVDILMGTRESGLLGESALAMTTFSQACSILDTLQEAGAQTLYSVLLGWQKEGYGHYPLSTSPADALGTAGEFKKLLASGGKNRHLFLQTDYVKAREGGAFSKQRDITYNFLHRAVTDSEQKLFLLNPFRQYQQFARRDLPAYEKLGAGGLAFDSLGSWLPADTSKNRRLDAADAKTIYTAMTELCAQQGLDTAVQTGSDYILAHAAYVYDAHDSSSGLFMFEREIPFYQMVLHGVLPYACSTPGNMSSDFETLKLKWVEYGSMPYFLVTHRPANTLRDSEVEDVFSSRFSDWQDTIADTALEFNDRLSEVFHEPITRHEVLAEELVCVSYASGHKVYVNYGGAPAETPDGTVSAADYLVVPPAA